MVLIKRKIDNMWRVWLGIIIVGFSAGIISMAGPTIINVGTILMGVIAIITGLLDRDLKILAKKIMERRKK